MTALLDVEVSGAAGELVEHGGAGAAHDHHGVGVDGGGAAAGVNRHDLAPLGIHGNLGARLQDGVALHIALSLCGVGGIEQGILGHGVLAAAAGFHIAGLGVARQDDGGGAAVVRDKGDDLILVIEHQGPPLALEGVGVALSLGGQVCLRLLVGCGPDGPVRGSVVRFHIDRQDDGVLLGLAQCRIVVAALSILAAQGVDKQLGGLATGQSGVIVAGQAVAQPDGLSQVHIALGPDGSRLLAGVAQHPNQNGGRLGLGDLLVRLKASITHTGDQGDLPLPVLDRQAGGQVHIALGPVLGGNVGEDSAGGVDGDLIPLLHKLDYHGAKLSPGQGAVWIELVASSAADHAHQAQDVSVDGGLPVGDIAEGGGAGRPDGHNCQRGGQGRGQQPRNQSFQFHVISPFHPPPGRGLS